jgi:23S rRNA (cytosine1962-C5)-methyltransferase
VVSYQIASQGFELRKEIVVALLKELLQPDTIVERNSTHLRTLEGLPLVDSIVYGESAETEITDARGTRFLVNALQGQKTGFYLDQMENRTRSWDFVDDGSALDLFANEGGFALSLARAGAASVIAVDQSATALENLRVNAKLNDVSGVLETIEGDCFEYLKRNERQHDLVVLDPPALVRSKRDLPVARKAYLNLNMGAMRATRPEGILFTASCSHHMTREMLLDVIHEASRKLRRPVSILAEHGAGIDHPVLISMPETAYLKLFILRIH